MSKKKKTVAEPPTTTTTNFEAMDFERLKRWLWEKRNIFKRAAAEFALLNAKYQSQTDADTYYDFEQPEDFWSDVDDEDNWEYEGQNIGTMNLSEECEQHYKVFNQVLDAFYHSATITKKELFDRLLERVESFITPRFGGKAKAISCLDLQKEDAAVRIKSKLFCMWCEQNDYYCNHDLDGNEIPPVKAFTDDPEDEEISRTEHYAIYELADYKAEYKKFFPNDSTYN